MIKIKGDYIKLGQLVKILGICDSGGSVKFMIDEFNILVNGEHETRRGRKIYKGDKVVIKGKQGEVFNDFLY